MKKKYSEGKPYKVIACVVANFAKEEPMRLIKQMTRACKGYQCKLVFFSTVTDFFSHDLIDAGEKKIFDLVRVEKYDAILLMSETFKQDEEQKKLVKRANEANVPIFAVDKCFDGCINLAFDYKSTFREIVKHMVEYHGYRTINFMGGMPDNSFSEERLNIYKEVLAENKIPYDSKRSYYGYFWEKPALEAMEKMFQDWDTLPEAIICANDSMALAVIKYLREKGYKVPEDVAVSGFDAIDLEQYSDPRLTTGIYKPEDMIRRVFEMIEEGNWSEYQKKVVPIHNGVQIGCSCRCSGLLPRSMADEMSKVKQDISLLMQYQSDVNQMVANYGNEDNLNEVVTAIAQYMRLLEYKDLWICFGERLMNYLEFSAKSKIQGTDITTENMVAALHYQMERESSFKGLHYVDFEELIPNSERFFEENDYCLINVIHLNTECVGYTIVRMDVDKFEFMIYEPFQTNLRHLLELQQSQRKIMRIYEKDQLTGLYNRNGFYKKIEALLRTREDKLLTIINIDMDGLKKVNDTYGHAEGDEALRSLGDILKNSITNEIAARIGGDEFLIAFAGTDNEERTNRIKALIIQGLAAYNQNSTKPYVLQASLGAFTDSIHKHSLDYFLRKADEMMYITKSQHKRETGDLR